MAARARISASVDRIRRTRRRKGVAGTAGAIARRVRQMVWAVDEVLVFTREREAVHSLSGRYREGCAHSKIDVRPGTLADLADLSATFPDEIVPGYLRDARLRLKNGDQLFIATHDDQVVHRVWLGIRNEVEPIDELGPGNLIRLDSPAPVIYDGWTAPTHRGQGVCPLVLRRLAQLAVSEGPVVYVYALSSNSASCRAIEKAGFVPWRTLGRRRLLGHFERRWMR
jgi:RimJ/RimL family protein N-acetyltransferase